ncbi:DUF6461 domain-containing protein [Nonomuraea aridisoli]|uniref:DUF6461 domain-containing protein n=1 Tax=Nonomuraea aridisoli TaxID=2070368 RepID=UPI0015E8B52D|nr:DUF6461 domain-containing protein [Nonomuraea aridisoli]
MTTDPLARFRWLQGQACPLDEIYTVLFVRERDPGEVLRRFGCGEGREMSFAELSSEVSDFLVGTDGGDGGGYVGVVAAGDWCSAVEPMGWSAVMDERLIRLSVDSEVVAVTRHDYADDHFAYAVDGGVVTTFELLTPDARYGADKDRLNHLMREVGLPPDETESDEEWEARYDDLAPNALARAFALAERLTGVTFTAGVLDGPLLVGPIVAAHLHDPARLSTQRSVTLAELVDKHLKARGEEVAGDDRVGDGSCGS